MRCEGRREGGLQARVLAVALQRFLNLFTHRAQTTQATQGEDSRAVDLDGRAAGARRLKDKVCVVTGAGQGIGRATARRLGQEGGKIVVADRIDASASEAVAELRESGVEATKTLVD